MRQKNIRKIQPKHEKKKFLKLIIKAPLFFVLLSLRNTYLGFGLALECALVLKNRGKSKK